MKKLFYLEAMKVYIHSPGLFLVQAYFERSREETNPRNEEIPLCCPWPGRQAWVICMMTSFYFYDQNPSGFCFLVQIKAFVC